MGHPRMEYELEIKKGDVSIYLRGTKEEILEKIEDGRDLLEKVLLKLQPSISVPSVGKPKTCKEMLIMLFQEGFFSTSRRLKEIMEEGARRAYRWDRFTYRDALKDLVQSSLLYREGTTTKSIKYIQKIPLDQATPIIDSLLAKE